MKLKLGPFIQANFAPNLAEPPERLGGEVAVQVAGEVALRQ